jgi:hypothetical protein
MTTYTVRLVSSAGLEELDFMRMPEEARKAINDRPSRKRNRRWFP